VTETEAPARRRVRRGEGEVTQWPRGVASYVPRGPEDAVPDPEEDRLRNRLLLAGRLIALLQAEGRNVEPYLQELRSMQRALQDGDRTGASNRVERLLGALDALVGPSGPPTDRPVR